MSAVLAVYGEFKVGKSWFGQTGEPPILLIESEKGGSDHTPRTTVQWNWRHEPSPPPSPSWQTAAARIESVDDLKDVVTASAATPFRTVVIDSFSDLQNRHMRLLAPPPDALRIQDWGTLKRDFLVLAAGLNAWAHSAHGPCVVIICRCALGEDGRFRPSLAGSFRDDMPYEVDALFHLSRHTDGRRVLQCAPNPNSLAGSNFGGKLPDTIIDPQLADIHHKINTERT